jgi:hypothetical protein
MLQTPSILFYSIVVALLSGFLAAQAQDSVAVNFRRHHADRFGLPKVERVLIGGMQKLGLDPAQIKALP